jgi:hypothetical protein
MPDEKDEKEDRKPSLKEKYALVPGVEFGDTIVVRMQYEFDCRAVQLSNEADLAKVRNGQFRLINWLAAIIIAEKPDRKDEVMLALGGLDTDGFSPKTQIQTHADVMSLKYDSVPVSCHPSELTAVLAQINTERVEVTVRKLWAVIRRLEIIAHEVGLMKKDYEVSLSNRDKILRGMSP